MLGQDAERIALYKPSGLPVFPPHGRPAGECLLHWWLGHGGVAADWPPGFDGGLAHRLDNRTDGLVIAARNPGALARLRQQFSAGILRKFYRFRSGARVDFTETLCELPIGHHARRGDRMVVQRGAYSRHRGKWYPAWTEFRQIEPGIWGAEIRTGVMHQVRVHGAAVGLPLDDDPLYGGAPGDFLLQHYRIMGPHWEFSLPDPADRG